MIDAEDPGNPYYSYHELVYAKGTASHTGRPNTQGQAVLLA